MSKEKRIVKSTDWLIKGYSEEEIASKKAEAIEEAEKEIRNKQIEEMAKILIDYKNKNHIMASTAILEDYAEEIYNAGYRKQSELTPCDVCKFNPPTSGDNKPCFICPAQAKGGAE
jgi:hypothetical protein